MRFSLLVPLSLRQIAGLLATHPRLILAVLYRPHKFIGKSAEEMPPDFHVFHVKLCLKRSARRYQKLYGDGGFQPLELLTKELAHLPCGRKSLLYVAVRLLRPSRVVETGVWFGFSTAQVLQALAENGAGELCSVDAPNIAYDAGSYWDAKLLPSEMQPGFVIPPALLNRWKLVSGYSRDVLPSLLQSIGPIDLFFHDSEHTYENMLFEYRVAWEHLGQGGALISDDVHLNQAFTDFCREVGTTPWILGTYGVTTKDPAVENALGFSGRASNLRESKVEPRA